MRNDMTQIDIPLDLAERLTEAAGDLGLLPWGLINKLLSDAQWAQSIQAAKSAMREASEETWADYEADVWSLDDWQSTPASSGDAHQTND